MALPKFSFLLCHPPPISAPLDDISAWGVNEHAWNTEAKRCFKKVHALSHNKIIYLYILNLCLSCWQPNFSHFSTLLFMFPVNLPLNMTNKNHQSLLGSSFQNSDVIAQKIGWNFPLFCHQLTSCPFLTISFLLHFFLFAVHQVIFFHPYPLRCSSPDQEEKDQSKVCHMFVTDSTTDLLSFQRLSIMLNSEEAWKMDGLSFGYDPCF